MKVRLIKGQSYQTADGRIRATSQHPEISVDAAVADALIDSGFFACADGKSDSVKPSAEEKSQKNESTGAKKTRAAEGSPTMERLMAE